MICPKCGGENPEGSKFCANCGTPIEVPVQEEPKVLSPNEAAYTRYGEEPKPVTQAAPDQAPQPQQYQQPQQPQQPYGAQPQQQYQQPYGQQQYYQNAPQQQKKKNKGCLIAVIIVLALFVIGGILLVVVGSLVGREIKNNGGIDSIIESVIGEYTYLGAEGVPYEKGSLLSDTYTNSWANIKLVLPSDYYDLDQEDYDRFNNEDTECALYVQNDNYDSLAVLFTDSTEYGSDYTASDYLNDCAATIENNYKSRYENAAVVTSQNYTDSIAGKQYCSASVTATANDTTVVDTLYVCKIDNYFCVLWMTGDTEEYNNDFVKNIVKVSE